jgi:hypothetical protein
MVGFRWVDGGFPVCVVEKRFAKQSGEREENAKNGKQLSRGAEAGKKRGLRPESAGGAPRY